MSALRIFFNCLIFTALFIALPYLIASPAAAQFLQGLAILAVFFWYFATDSDRLKRVMGTMLTALVLVLAVESFWPVKEPKLNAAGEPIPGEYNLKRRINLGLDLQGGSSFLIRLMRGDEQEKVDEHTRDKAVEVIRARIDKFGVSEPVITPEGSDRILVQIPGMSPEKIEEARQQLQKVAKLEFRLVHPRSDQLIEAIEAGEAPIPPGYIIAEEESTRHGVTTHQKLLIRDKADISGEHVAKGRPFYENHSFGVSLRFTNKGAELFGDLTSKHVGQRFAILLDGKVQSAPVIKDAIRGGNAQITGNFTQADAQTLASVLENPLSVPVKIEEERSVSSTLGEDAIYKGVLAGLGGLLLVLLIMGLYYRLAGLIAIFALAINIVLLLGVMGMFNFVLTLPGIAGIILTIGMAVDANVLIFERLREELAAGKGLAASIHGAYSKALGVIVDANVTSLITAVILFWFAVGPVKGFAVTLTIGIIASVFTALIVSRNCFDWGIANFGLTKVRLHHLIPSTLNINFLRHRRLWISISVIAMIASVAVLAVRGKDNFGIDFLGGQKLVLSSQQDVDIGAVRQAIEPLGLADAVIQKSQRVTEGVAYQDIEIRSRGGSADEIITHLNTSMPQANFTKQSLEEVGATVGRELAWKSAIALGLGLLGILVYVTMRFEFSFALAAVIAQLHDVIIAVGIFALLGREFSMVMIGAVLTLAGYSINDTIVIFDRIREGFRSGRKGSIQEIMNACINETLPRTLLISGTMLVSVLTLLLFGGETLSNFALIIVIGVIVGTYSSIFVASPLVLWWSRRAGVNLREIKKKGETPAV